MAMRRPLPKPLPMALLCLMVGAAVAATPADLSLEDLLKADVVTASRKSQALQGVPAAVFVISREDIERAGAASLPEALRLAPGIQVARLSADRWAVSARGFNGRFANKLLVLMDGRSIYSPLFSGVMWELEGTLMEDIERIEVIRGPGAALWGANAVNGVINIITRKARDTTDTLLTLGAGSQARGSIGLRQGWALAGGHVRLWARSEAQRGLDDARGGSGPGGAHTTRLGFRGDWTLASGQGLTLSGSATDNRSGDRWAEASLASATGARLVDRLQRTRAAHVLARWSLLGGDGSETIVQSYLERHQISADTVVHQQRSTFDLDVQHRPRLDGAHDLVLGGSLRHSVDQIQANGILVISPERRRFTLTSVFINDEISLLPERLRATLGLRLEHNSFTGFEPQPQARLAWTPNRSQTLWAAASRAVRTPSRAEPDAQVDLSVMPGQAGMPPLLLRNLPPANHRLDSETVQALEAGYRHQFDGNLSLDLALFQNRYRHVLGASLGAAGFELQPVPHAVQTISPTNLLAGTTAGLELALDWRPQRQWRLQAGYSHLRSALAATVADPVAQGAAASRNGSAPRHQLALRASLTPAPKHDLDLALRHVGALVGDGQAAARIDAYTTLDLRWAWRAQPGLLLALSAENLLQRRHAEFVPDALPSQTLLVPRAARLKAQWQF